MKRYSPLKSLFFVQILIIYAGTGYSLPASSGEPYPATVVRAPAGDILTLDRDGKREVVSLFGVRTYATTLPPGQRAKSFVKTHVEGKRVAVHPVDTVYGVTQVRVTLPNGSDLGLRLLRAGLAKWDEVAGPELTSYRDAQSAARAQGAGIWGSPAQSAGSEPPAGDERGAGRSELYAQQLELKRLAQFEAELELWRALAPGQREALLEAERNRRAAYLDSLAATDATLSGQLAEVQQRQTALGNEIGRRESAIAELNESEAVYLEEVYNDPGLIAEQRAMDGLVFYQRGVAYGDLPWIASIAATEAQAFRLNQAMAEINSIAASVSSEFERERAGEIEAIGRMAGESNRLEEVANQIERNRRAVQRIEYNQSNYFAARLARLAMLEEAMQQEYETRLKTRNVTRFEDDIGGELPGFDIDARLWRMDVTPFSAGGGWAFNVRDLSDNAVVARVSSRDAPYEWTRVIDGPGRFAIDVELPEMMNFKIRVLEYDE